MRAGCTGNLENGGVWGGFFGLFLGGWWFFFCGGFFVVAEVSSGLHGNSFKH